MDISIISLIGIIVGVALFVFMSFKKVPLVVAACMVALFIALLSGQPIMGLITGTWATGFANFMKGYFFPLTLSAVIGKLMNDAGAARRIAMGFYGLIRKSKKNPKFTAMIVIPVLYTILTCCGISGFVVVFTMVGLSKEIMQEFDIPWRMYCYGGSTAMCQFWIPGSITLTNIAATKIAGVSLTAAPMFGIVITAAFWVVAVLLIWFELKKAEKNGEGFMDTGAEFLKTPMANARADGQELPNLAVSILPLGCAMVLAVVFSVEIVIALFIGVVLASVCYHKYMPSYMQALGDGVSSAFSPLMSSASATGVGSVIAAVPGFQIIMSGLSTFPPVLEGMGYIIIICFALASPAGGVSSFGPQALECMLGGGLSAGVSARLIALSTFTGVPPHSPAIANVVAVTKIEYRHAVVVYLKVCLIGGGFASLVALLTINLGLFV